MKVPPADYDRIVAEISSDDSPVGIDARKAHAIIIHMLTQIDRRLRDVEEQIGGSSRGL